MRRLLLTRIGGGLASVFGASIISFIMLRVLPGNPARVIVGPLASRAAVAAETRLLGLKEPLYVQYVSYIGHFFRGDWGYSTSNGEPVAQAFANRFPATAELALYAFLFAVIGAVGLALLATYKRRPKVDGPIRAIAFIGLGTPPFWLGLILLIVFFSHLGWLPGPFGRLSQGVPPPAPITHLYTIDALLEGEWGTFVNAVQHLILPVICLGFGPFAYLVRLLRGNMLDVSREPFMIVARSKGLHRWAAFSRHALPNALLPTLTSSAIILVQLLTGSVLVESIFNWPGIGNLVFQAVLVQDYSVVEAFILLSAVAYVVTSGVVDILYGLLDPRTRRQAAAGG